MHPLDNAITTFQLGRIKNKLRTQLNSKKKKKKRKGKETTDSLKQNVLVFMFVLLNLQ